MSKRSTIFGTLTLLAVNLSRNVRARMVNEVMEERGRLLIHFKVVPASVPTNTLQRTASLPPEINI